MEVTKNKPYFDTLEKGQVLTVTITGGSAIVCGKIGTTEVLAENPTSTTIYGPYASDINFRVSYVSGVIDATESISSTPLLPQQITAAAFSAAQASGSLDTSAMYDVDGTLYRYNRVTGLWESVGDVELINGSVESRGRFTNAVYDGSTPPRLTSCTKNGINIVITYPTSDTATITYANGLVRNVTYDAVNHLVTSAI